MEESNLKSTDNQTNSKKSNRGGARPGAGRKKKSNAPLTNEARIAAIEKRIQDPNINPRDLKSLNRELSLLKGEYVPYTRTAEQKRAVKSAVKQSDSLPIGWVGLAPIFVERRALGLPMFEGYDAQIQGRSVEFLEHQLDVYEEEWAAKKGFVSVAELRQYLRWTAQHQGEPLPPDCAEVQLSKLRDRQIELSDAVKTGQQSAWVAYLKETEISLNAGPTLSPGELQDVVLARAKAAEQRATWRTAEQILIERFRKEK